jgi:hypothetical protein
MRVGSPGDSERDLRRRAPAIDRNVDPRGEESFARRDQARLIDRLARELVEQLVGGLGVALPADEPDIALQRGLQFGRRVDDDSIRGGRRLGRGLCRERVTAAERGHH